MDVKSKGGAERGVEEAAALLDVSIWRRKELTELGVLREEQAA